MAMAWSDEVGLITLESELDDDGFPIQNPGEPKFVFANRLSVRSTEFHMAKQRGVELSHMFEIHAVEYSGQEKVKYEEKIFDVERTYEKGEIIELVLRKRGDDHAV